LAATTREQRAHALTLFARNIASSRNNGEIKKEIHNERKEDLVKRFLRGSCIIRNFVAFGIAGFLFITVATSTAQAQNTSQIAMGHPGWVQVPGELVRPDCVHAVPNGANIRIGDDGQPTGDVFLNGQLIAHYDPCPELPISTRYQTSVADNGGVPAINGWVEDSQWDISLGSGDNIDLLNGYWYVPTAPQETGGLVYLFNGISTTREDWLLQPVLQYGVGYAGGGNYWTIACWLVSAYGNVYYSPLKQLNVGNWIYGTNEMISNTGGTPTWRVAASSNNVAGYTALTVTTSSSLQWTWAYAAVLEAYGITSCSMLPASGSLSFMGSNVYHGYPNYIYISPQQWGGAVFQTGGLNCPFNVTISGNTSTLYF
jgi:hypothetical protein